MITEGRNPNTLDLDLLETREVVQLINLEDQSVASAVASALPEISRAIDEIVDRLTAGGRLFYVGAGTSGRLAVLDAAECPPTFGVSNDLVKAVLAGGREAYFSSVEGAEDSSESGAADLADAGASSQDAVFGVAASGGTPYTCGAIEWANKIGALTVGLSCNPGSLLCREAQIGIEIETGPEVIAGSTRMKAGTAQKMVLNMISTGTMVRLGHVYENLMVNVQLLNKKLIDRGARIVAIITGVSSAQAREKLLQAGDAKTAVVMIKRSCSLDTAREILRAEPRLRFALRK